MVDSYDIRPENSTLIYWTQTTKVRNQSCCGQPISRELALT